MASTAAGTATASSTAPIKVEVIAPFSGPEGYLGQPTMNGLQLALKDVGGTIAGRPVELIKADAKCTPSNAVQLVRQIASDASVAATFGPICSGSMAAVQKTMSDAKIVHITNGYGASLTTAGDQYIFVGVANGDQQVAALEPYVTAQHAVTAAVVQGNDGFSQQLAVAEKALLKKLGIKIVYNGTFEDTTTDYSGQIAGVKSSGAGVVLIAAYESNTGGFTKQLRQEGVGVPAASPDGCDPAVTSVTGKFGDNLAFALNFCPEYPKFASFVSTYKSAHHATPDDAVAGAYTGGIALFEGLKASGGQGGSALRQAMLKLDVQSKLGEISYASNGSLKNPEIVVGELVKGKPTFSAPGN